MFYWGILGQVFETQIGQLLPLGRVREIPGIYLLLEASAVNSVATREKYLRILIQRLGLGMHPLWAWIAWMRAISLAMSLLNAKTIVTHYHLRRNNNLYSVKMYCSHYVRTIMCNLYSVLAT